MDEFMPSRRVLEKICSNSTPVRNYTYFPTNFNPDEMYKTFNPFIAGLIHQIAEHYQWDVNLMENMNTQAIVLVVDALSNAVVHGSKNRNPVIMGLFMGENGVCYGFRDSGDFFKSEKTKHILENKLNIEEFDKSALASEFECCNLGFKASIYPNVDDIEIDTKKGVFYCVQLKDGCLSAKNYKIKK